MKTKEQEKKNARIMYHLLFIMFVDITAFSCILPLFPSILQYYHSNSTKGDLYSFLNSWLNSYVQALGIQDNSQLRSVFFGGLLGSLFCALQFLSTPWFGAMSDSKGRKQILLLSVGGSAISYALWLQASGFSIFLISRIVGGLTKVTMPIAMAVISDILPAYRRAHGMALLGIMFSLGFIFGPATGAFIAHRVNQDKPGAWSIRAPALFALCLTVLEFVWIKYFLTETLPEFKRAKSRAPISQRLNAYLSPGGLFRFDALKLKHDNEELRMIRKIGLTYFLYLFTYSGLEFTMTFLARQRFHFDNMQQGKMFLFIGVLMILVQGGFVRRLKPDKHRTAIILVPMIMRFIPELFHFHGLLSAIAGYTLIAWAASVWHFYAAISLYALASAVVVPCTVSQLSSYVSPSKKGVALGIFRALGALARAIGPIWASTVFWLLGSKVCYLSGAALTSLPLLLYNQS